MAEYAKRACCDCFHYTACKAILEASGLGNYMSTVSHGDRCPDFVHKDDVTTVRHGRWDSIPNTYMCVAGKDGSYHGYATSCSVCHEINPNAYKTNYCPNCGCRMDGGTD